MKIDRLLSIIVYLLNHDMVSARTLAGIPLVSIQGPNGSYGIMEDFKLDSQLVSVEDLYYIITSLKSVSGTLTDGKMDNTLEKMKTLLPSREDDVLSGRDEKLSIDFTMLGGYPRHQEAFGTVREAVDSERL